MTSSAAAEFSSLTLTVVAKRVSTCRVPITSSMSSMPGSRAASPSGLAGAYHTFSAGTWTISRSG